LVPWEKDPLKNGREKGEEKFLKWTWKDRSIYRSDKLEHLGEKEEFIWNEWKETKKLPGECNLSIRRKYCHGARASCCSNRLKATPFMDVVATTW